MTVLYTAVPSEAHTEPTHPENVSRMQSILAALRTGGLIARLTEIAPTPAPLDQVAAVHDLRYISALQAAMSKAPAYLDPAPTYITPASYDCALLAAGGAIAAVNAVISNLQLPVTQSPSTPPAPLSAFALIRPPGHHATPTQAMGFCLLNNIAIAARRALASGIRRVMIVDFDVHHGNGTQDCFYRDESVLFISTHQQGIYPGTGRVDEIGEGAGRGFTINVPLPSGAGDAAFEQIAAQVFHAAAERFRPELLLVSAGFDAHWADPLASLGLSITGYYRLARSLMAIAERHCQGRIVFVLEGGYDGAALAHSVAAVFHALLGDAAAPDPLGPASRREPNIARTLEQVRAVHEL